MGLLGFFCQLPLSWCLCADSPSLLLLPRCSNVRLKLACWMTLLCAACWPVCLPGDSKIKHSGGSTTVIGTHAIGSLTDML